jgi:hypothetical protein
MRVRSPLAQEGKEPQRIAMASRYHWITDGKPPPPRQWRLRRQILANDKKSRQATDEFPPQRRFYT